MSDKKEIVSCLKNDPSYSFINFSCCINRFYTDYKSGLPRRSPKAEKSLEDINKIHLPPIALSLFYEDVDKF